MNLTPRGCSCIGGELALSMEDCRARALGLFTSYGYNPFNPAEFQLLEGTMKNLARRRRERIIAVNSPFGEPCCMRTDITLSALSYMAMHYEPEDFPLRLCYAERVFSVPRPPRENLEEAQIGVELLGWEGIGSDVEVIVLLLRMLDALGLDESVLVLGDASIVPGLFKDLPGALSQLLLEQLQEGAYYDFVRTVAAADELPEEARLALRELPWLKGTTDILPKARALFGATPFLDSLANLCDMLNALGYGPRIRIDLGFIRDLNYYCGPIFNAYSSERGDLLGGGGRYAGSLSETWFSCQAVGFGMSLRELAQAAPPRARGIRATVWAGGMSAQRVMTYVDALTKKNIPFEISWNPDETVARKLAESKGYSWWIDLPGACAHEIATGRRVPLSELEEVLGCR